jgi:hypothetical protein
VVSGYKTTAVPAQHTTERHSCPPAGFETAIPTIRQSQTYALDRAPTGIGEEVSVERENLAPTGSRYIF